MILSTLNARLDSRGRPGATAVASGGNAAPVLANRLAQVFMAAQTNFEFILDEHHQITLLPGDAVQIRSTAVTFSSAMSIFWRERFLEESERA